MIAVVILDSWRKGVFCGLTAAFLEVCKITSCMKPLMTHFFSNCFFYAEFFILSAVWAKILQYVCLSYLKKKQQKTGNKSRIIPQQTGLSMALSAATVNVWFNDYCMGWEWKAFFQRPLSYLQVDNIRLFWMDDVSNVPQTANFHTWCGKRLELLKEFQDLNSKEQSITGFPQDVCLSLKREEIENFTAI